MCPMAPAQEPRRRSRSTSPAAMILSAAMNSSAKKAERRGSQARVASGLLAVWGLPEPVRLLGVGVTNLVPGDAAQLPLFAAGRARRERLNQALDAIADRFGSDALSRGEPDSAPRAGLSDQIKRGARDDEA